TPTCLSQSLRLPHPRAYTTVDAAVLVARPCPNPRPPGSLVRPLNPLPATLFCACGRRRYAVDPDVIIPVRTRYLRATVHHAATGRAAGGKRLVGAHRAHIDRAILGPTEQPRIERKFPIEVVGIKLVPADVARGH